jgi:hypothetical protein
MPTIPYSQGQVCAPLPRKKLMFKISLADESRFSQRRSFKNPVVHRGKKKER